MINAPHAARGARTLGRVVASRRIADGSPAQEGVDRTCALECVDAGWNPGAEASRATTLCRHCISRRQADRINQRSGVVSVRRHEWENNLEEGPYRPAAHRWRGGSGHGNSGPRRSWSADGKPEQRCRRQPQQRRVGVRGYDPADYWLVGDTFQNNSSSTWYIDGISLWTVGSSATETLWGGIGSSVGVVAPSGVKSLATYADTSTYQGYSNNYSAMYRVDFSVNITLAPGQTYNFFLDGNGGSNVVPFAHASNAALSGSTQQGSDDQMLYGRIVGGLYVPADAGSWTSLGDGWDKASDVNVLVTGTVPDGGTTMTLLGCALAGLGALRRKFRS